MYNGDFLNNLAVNIFPVIVALVVYLYKIAVQYLPANKQSHLKLMANNMASIADTVVSGVEQSMAGAPGIEKKAQAANDIEAILGSLGIKVAPELVSHAIEGAVYAMNQYKPAPVAAKAEAPAATSPVLQSAEAAIPAK